MVEHWTVDTYDVRAVLLFDPRERLDSINLEKIVEQNLYESSIISKLNQCIIHILINL